MAIAVDLDGTLAEYHGWKGPAHIGDAIPAMVKRVRGWVADGEEVIIFTARQPIDEKAIHAWLNKHGMPSLEITNVKVPKMMQIWDDRAVSVIPNTGEMNNRHYTGK